MTGESRDEPDPRGRRAARGTSRIEGQRILYVDDDPSVRWATSELLGDAGAICLLAGTHEQAVAIVRREPALALAILDFQMPDGDVLWLARRLRAGRSVLPLIGTSATDRRDEFAARGVTQFLEKPWELGDLLRALDASDPHFQLTAPLDPWMSARSLGD